MDGKIVIITGASAGIGKESALDLAKHFSHSISFSSNFFIFSSEHIKWYKDLYTSSRANFYEDYKAEIIDIRNELAHCADRIEGSKEILITRKGDKSFNKEDIKEVRKNILKYSALFAKLLQF